MDECLDSRVGDTLFVGQAVEDLTHGAGPEFPALLEDSRLGLRERRLGPAGLLHDLLRRAVILLHM
jgi:hypothetical protein